MPCRINKQHIWSTRLILEGSCHVKSCCLTLTYTDEYIPGRLSLAPEHARDFIKRLRKRVKRKLRYFLVGEYGEKKGRPHYHVAVFGLSQDDARREVPHCWTYGGIDYGYTSVTRDFAKYIGKYVTKKWLKTDEYNRKVLDGRQPEFVRMSRKPGIGVPALRGVVTSFNGEKVRRWFDETQLDVPVAIKVGRDNMPLGPFIRGVLREALGISKKRREAAKFELAQKVQDVFYRKIIGEKHWNKSFASVLAEIGENKAASVEARAKIFSTGVF